MADLTRFLANVSFLTMAFGASAATHAHVAAKASPGLSSASRARTTVLADTQTLKKLNLPAERSAVDTTVSLASLTGEELARLSTYNHEAGRCGGYQIVDPHEVEGAFARLSTQLQQEKLYRARQIQNRLLGVAPRITRFDPKIRDAVREVSEKEIGDWVSWLVAFGSRYHALSDPNRHTVALAERLRALTGTAGFPVAVDLISHQRTRQKSVRVSLRGATKPEEIVVLGGHLDSIVQFGDKNNAPGADDNASGSAALLESLRLVLKQGQPARTLEYFFYAAEEVGLVGSAEIARAYKAEKKNVVGVLQLDMTLFPGSGEGVISSISDYTTGWMRDMLVEFNRDYLNVQIVDDKCGYACSDHASWYQQGYPTLMPFEARLGDDNKKIHTPNDRVSTSSSFKHAAIFAKIAVAYAMHLAGGTAP